MLVIFDVSLLEFRVNVFILKGEKEEVQGLFND